MVYIDLMTQAYLSVTLVVAAGVLGFLFQLHRPAVRTVGGRQTSVGDKSGWVYFIAASKDTETPIKVGMSRNDPTKDRLTELRTMSPYPLRVLYKVRVNDRYAAERAAHEALAPFRLHGEWFDRDATMAYIDHLKGEA